MLLGNSLKYVPIDRALKRNVILKNQSLKEIGQGVPMKNHPAFRLLNRGQKGSSTGAGESFKQKGSVFFIISVLTMSKPVQPL